MLNTKIFDKSDVKAVKDQGTNNEMTITKTLIT